MGGSEIPEMPPEMVVRGEFSELAGLSVLVDPSIPSMPDGQLHQHHLAPGDEFACSWGDHVDHAVMPWRNRRATVVVQSFSMS